jgi:stage III sporulation protein AA
MCGIPEFIRFALPERARDDIEAVASRQKRVEEIRLHCGRRVTLTSSGKNIPTSSVLTKQEMDRTLTRLCEGSVYAFRDTIADGYIGLRGGVRVGVCGRAALSGGKICGVYDIDTLVIRIPHPSPALGKEIADLIRKENFTSGVLIYSPPGVGKTTLLRSLAKIMSSGENAVRVSVIDTRGELGYSLGDSGLCLDILSGYPKHIGISIASRTLSPQVIICDEIGDTDEAMSMVSAHHGGVPLVASAHGGSLPELLRRTGIRLLHESGLFGAYVGIRRDGHGGFTYRVHTHGTAEGVLAGQYAASFAVAGGGL